MTLALSTGLGLRWWQATRPPTLPSSVTSVTVPRPSGPNALHFYAAAADAITQSALDIRNPEELKPAERQAILNANAEALRLLRQGFTYRAQGAATNWMRTAPAAGLSAPVPNYIAQRALVRLLATDAHNKAALGDHSGAVQAGLEAVRFGNDLGRGADSLIGAMIGNLCVGIGLNAVAPASVNALTGDEARAAARRLEGLIADTPTASDALLAEKRFGLSALNGLFQARVNASEVPGSALLAPLILWHGKQGIVDRYSAFMDAAARRASLPYKESLTVPLQSHGLGWLGDTMIPNFDKGTKSITEHAAKARVLLTNLALQAYRTEHGGRNPALLDELTVGPNPYLTRVPADPLSPDGRAPLRYLDGKAFSVGLKDK